jgi:type II secretory pathway component PulF
MVRAGEEGGMLASALLRLADHYERDDELRGQVKGALAYPVFLVLVGTATVFVLMTFVVPKFVSLFQGFGQQLPLPTRMLISVSLFLGNYWWVLLIGLVGALLLLRQAAKTQEGRSVLDRLKISLPLWGPVLKKLEVARFAATLGSLLEGGVPILQSLDISSQTVRNVHIRNPVESAREVVREGGELADSLASSRDFPALVANLVSIGQVGGNLPGMLHKVASIYQRETDRTVRTMTALLEPFLIFVLGGVVALVVSGILLPVFRMNVLVQ